jgi:glycosyltransferase involved in cell wall biosynthesis
MPNPSLSLCMIVKNEERHVARCLASVRDLVDDIVLVDTGSTDGTLAIAERFGARVFPLAWQDDFSLARNHSLEQARGEWILVLDADESIAACDHAPIRAGLCDSALNAVTAYQRHYLAQGTVVGWQPGPGGYEEGKPYPGFFDVECRRLFRNRPWLRFQNRVHEELVSSDPGKPLAQTRGPWIIHHYGKVDGDAVLKAKGEAYLRIGRKKIEDRPKDPLAHYELGIQYLELGQPTDAAACFERVQTLHPNFRDTLLRQAICQVRLRQFQKALVSLRLAARGLPQFAAEIALEEGNVRRALDDMPAAERAFKRAIAHNPTFAASSVNLALVYKRSDRIPEALTALDQVLVHCPGHFESLALRAQLRRDTGDLAGALADLESLGSHPGALRLRARILVGQQRFAEARGCLLQLGEAADAEVAALRGAVALGLGEREEAIAALRSSLQIHESQEAAMNLSAALEASGDREGAIDAATVALKLAPDDPAALRRFSQLASTELGARARSDESPFTIFFYNPFGIMYDARTPRTRGLGGTESAVVYLAEALAERGHRIVVLNNCEEPGRWSGVEYARWETMPARAVSDRPDVLVAIRYWQAIGRARFAPLQIFWTGDAYDQPFLEGIDDPKRRAGIDLVALESRWQADTFSTHHGIPPWRIAQHPYGFAASAAGLDGGRSTRPVPDARRRTLAYTSTPFRGLDVLLDLFPRIRAACPDAELEVFSSMRVYGMAEEDDRRQFRALYRKAKQPGVTLVGTVPQLELAERLRDIRVLAYPNSYPETFCIAALEAQAAGCVVVTSELGALPETVGCGGVCLPGEITSPDYQRAFVEACVRLLTDDEAWQSLSRGAIAHAWDGYTWSAVAATWDTLCRRALAPEPPLVDRIARHLASGRAPLAMRMLDREAAPDMVLEEDWQALRELAAWRADAGSRPDLSMLRKVAQRFPTIRRLALLERWQAADESRRTAA